MSNNESISVIFLSWRKYLTRMVSRMVPPHEIEDIVQETYVRACQFSSTEVIQSPGAFMSRIARNLAIDHLKRAERKLTCSYDEENVEMVNELGLSDDGPESQAASLEEFALFCESVRQLPLQCRKVFVLKKVYGYTQKEIAQELNLSENTVEKHIAQGVKRCTLHIRRHNESGYRFTHSKKIVIQEKISG